MENGSSWTADSFGGTLQRFDISDYQGLRSRSYAKFVELGWPRPSLEEWKYTPFGSLEELPPTPLPTHAITSADLSVWGTIGATSGRIVFSNGEYTASVSKLPEQCLVEVVTLDEGGIARLAQAGINWEALPCRSALSHLHKACAARALVIQLPRHTVLKDPIEVIWANHAVDAGVVFPLLFVGGSSGSKATIIERFFGLGAAASFTCGRTSLTLAPNAAISYLKIQEEGESAQHWHELYVSQEADTSCRLLSASLGGSRVRNEIYATLSGSGGHLDMLGLTIGDKRRHIDNTTEIDHAVAHCESREVYKGVYADASAGTFSGTIIVQPQAQKTNAIQSNKGLLLSRDAVFNTRPQLKIWADDVKCTHGAAVGQLDEDALFYLRSRGIPRQTAMSLLTHAFCREIIAQIGHEGTAQYLEDRVANHLDQVWSRL